MKTSRFLSYNTLPRNSVCPMSFALGFFALTLFAQNSQAVVITELVPTSTGYDSVEAGQSVTTPTGGPWNNLQFNFFDTAFDPVAVGDLYILTAEYLGTPAALSASTPGYVAKSTGITGGSWTFNSTASLAPSTRYWFYADTPFNKVEESGALPAELNYLNFTGNYEVYTKGYDFSFRLEGAVAASSSNSGVPEPSTLTLAALGFLALMRRRKQKA